MTSDGLLKMGGGRRLGSCAEIALPERPDTVCVDGDVNHRRIRASDAAFKTLANKQERDAELEIKTTIMCVLVLTVHGGRYTCGCYLETQPYSATLRSTDYGGLAITAVRTEI